MLKNALAVVGLVSVVFISGISGCAAPDGPQGADGVTGPTGATGAKGADGTNGTNGKDGVNGEAGPQGVKGDPGSSVGFPAGIVVPFAGPAAQVPAGWALCDGSAVSRTSPNYSTLFGVIGTLHGSGDGTTTFNLPDYRGRFLRGTDLGAGHDPNAGTRTAPASGGSAGDAVGSLEGSATKLPNTSFTTDTQGAHTHAANGAFAYGSPDDGQSPAEFGNGSNFFYHLQIESAGAHSHTVTGGGDAESRPVNAGVNYIIKL